MGKNIIVACDFSSEAELRDFLNQIEAVDEDIYCKVGMELFDSGALKRFSPVELIKERGHKVFLDLKLHDIPNTVAKTIKSLAKYGVEMINVHATGGYEMMKAAVDAVDEVYSAYEEELETLAEKKIQAVDNICGLQDWLECNKVDNPTREEQCEYEDIEETLQEVKNRLNSISNKMKEVQTTIDNKPIILAVTVLTSISDEILQNELGVDRTSLEHAVELAKLAKSAGCKGVVCSPREAMAIKEACGEDFVTVTPGIRFKEEAKGDQKRVATPAFANIIGSDYIVVGRSITAAQDKVAAYQRAKKDFTEEVIDADEIENAKAYISELKAGIITPLDDTAKKLLEIGAFKINTEDPFILKSGIAAPIYCNCRDLYKYPLQQKVIVDYLANMVKEKYPDAEAIYGTAMSAISLGALVAERLGLPSGFVRQEAKDHGISNVIEGPIYDGIKIVQIEDLITTGQSSLKPIKVLQEAGANVLGVAAIVDNFAPSTYLIENDIEYHTLTTMAEIAKYASMQGIISPEDFDRVEAYMNNPTDESWMSKNASIAAAKKRALRQ